MTPTSPAGRCWSTADDDADRVRRSRLPGRARAGRTTRRPASVCGHALPAGLEQAQKLPEPLFTPGHEGHRRARHQHRSRDRQDPGRGRPLRPSSSGSRSSCTRRLPTTPRRAGSSSPTPSSSSASTTTNELVLGDEVLTPDSSRFWPADSYQVGTSPQSFDKQYVRDWLRDARLEQGSRPAPRSPPTWSPAPAALRRGLRVLTGGSFDAYLTGMGVTP